MKNIWMVLLLVFIFTGCHKVNRLTGSESQPDNTQTGGTASELVILACCYDTSAGGREVYPAFVPVAHADLCYAAKRNPNAGDIVYIPMHTDCARANYVGHEYYDGHAGY